MLIKQRKPASRYNYETKNRLIIPHELVVIWDKITERRFFLQMKIIITANTPAFTILIKCVQNKFDTSNDILVIVRRI